LVFAVFAASWKRSTRSLTHSLTHSHTLTIILLFTRISFLLIKEKEVQRMSEFAEEDELARAMAMSLEVSE
jgi:hypothetical protein